MVTNIRNNNPSSVSFYASVDGRWMDLKMDKEILLDILDTSEISAVDADVDADVNIS